MKKVLLTLFAALFVAASPMLAQDGDADGGDGKPWKKGGMGSLTFSDVGLSNWAAGGNSQTSLIGNLNLFANRTWESATWENTLDLAYGFLKVRRSPITKAEDKIDFNSKYGRKAWSEKVFYSGLVNFRSQFDFGRTNPGDPVYISRFMAPAYLVFALGLDYKPNDDWSFFFGPASGKITIVSDDSLASVGAFGVNQLNNPEDPNSGFLPGNSENVRVEIGATFRAKFKKDFTEKIGFESNLELFSNYIDRPQNIDVRWNNAFVAKLTKYLTMNIFTDLIYDHDIKINLFDDDGAPIYSVNTEPVIDAVNGGLLDDTWWPGPGYLDGSDLTDVVQVQKQGPRVQFKRVFGLGFAYKF